MTVKTFLKLAFNTEASPAIHEQLLTKRVDKLSLHKLREIAIDVGIDFPEFVYQVVQPRCRVCGCTDDNCAQCIEKTGEPCSWVEADLCSACADVEP